MKGFIALFALAISLAFSSVHAEEPNGPVNINTASAEELSELKGVGKTKAEAIVAHRNEHGE
ncbi:MAG: helix-hairpin-helix domain-containing protein, partial [Pseudomonadota bacterium]|nr:helix-hairpin-helix domain-containing protein [Pseudomonadota bacterium]